MQASQVDHRALHTIGSRNTTVELVAAVFELYADRPVCGSWDDTAGSFVTVTYRELWDVVVALASGQDFEAMNSGKNTRRLCILTYGGLRAGGAGLVAQGLQPGDFVGICGFSSMDWWICELACLYAGTSLISSLPRCPLTLESFVVPAAVLLTSAMGKKGRPFISACSDARHMHRRQLECASCFLQVV